MNRRVELKATLLTVTVFINKTYKIFTYKYNYLQIFTKVYIIRFIIVY